MLSGNWKNFDELEDSISYPELTAMVQAQRDRDERLMRFQAALKGINLDGDKKNEDDPVEAAKRRVRARMTGESEEVVDLKMSMGAAGFAVEIED